MKISKQNAHNRKKIFMKEMIVTSLNPYSVDLSVKTYSKYKSHRFISCLVAF